MGLLDKAKMVVFNVSLEPVFFLFCVNLGLVMIPNADLYLSKVGSFPTKIKKSKTFRPAREIEVFQACQVNLNYSSTICSNRSDFFNENGTVLHKDVRTNKYCVISKCLRT